MKKRRFLSQEKEAEYYNSLPEKQNFPKITISSIEPQDARFFSIEFKFKQ